MNLAKLFWLLGRKPKLLKQQHSHMQSKLKPVWTYGIQLWGTMSTSNIERFQSKALRVIVDAHWYVPNTAMQRDLKTLTVKEEISHYSLSIHPNDLLVNLMAQQDNNRRLRRYHANDLPTRFLV
jgi:hypothetical protein